MTAPGQLDSPPHSAAADHASAVRQADSPAARLGSAAQQLIATAIERLAHAAADKVEDLAGRLDEIRAGGGVGLNAAIGGGLAHLQGKNPVWAAIKAGVSAMSTTTKVVVALLLILTAVLAPVLAIVLALILLVTAGVSGARRGQ